MNKQKWARNLNRTIQGKELNKKWKEFEDAHPEIDSGWLRDLLSETIDLVIDSYEKEVYKDITK